MREEAGAENFFLFGLTADEVERVKREGYRPADRVAANLVLADYTAYIACQEDISAAWTDTEHWTRMSILNTARGGKFSSDRSIREYCDDIWGVEAVPVRLLED